MDAGVDEDVSIRGGCEQMSAVAEGADVCTLHGKFPKRPDVINQQVHQSNSVGKARQNVQTGRMQRDGMDGLLEFAGEFHVESEVVPNADRLVHPARYHWKG